MQKHFASLLLIVAAHAFGCGGGDAAPVDGLDNSGVPNDTNVPNDSTVPNDSIVPSPAALPIDSDVPTDTSSPPPGGQAPGLNPTCPSICQRATEEGCGEEFSGNECVSQCAQLASGPCADQTLAVIACALSVGLCLEDSATLEPALTTACLGQILAQAACAGVDVESP